MKRTPMKRAAFKRAGSTTAKSGANRAAALEERAVRAIKSAASTATMKSEQNQRLALNGKALTAIKRVAPASTMAAPIPKTEIVCSERYRRLVASLPCAHCGIYGYSQHAHVNEGKGMGLKTDDRAGMPLCCARPGEEGCHAKFDQYRLLPGGREAHRAAGKKWSAQTRARIKELGLWPANLPQWGEESEKNEE